MSRAKSVLGLIGLTAFLFLACIAAISAMHSPLELAASDPRADNWTSARLDNHRLIFADASGREFVLQAEGGI